MNCHRIISRCECGGYTQPFSLWITDNRAVLVSSHCTSCEKKVDTIYYLTDLYKHSRHMNDPVPKALPAGSVQLFTPEDMDFLKDIGGGT